MYKTKLQELCHQKQWSSPNYSLTRYGVDHRPLFKASVLVNGVSFDCPEVCKSSKEAQSEAARIALEYLTSPTFPVSSSVSSSSPLSSSTGSSSAITILRNVPSGKFTLLGNNEETSKISPSRDEALGVKHDQELGDVQNLCKSQLQNYVQKRSLSSPVYSCIRNGSPHAPRFKAMVTVDGKTFESPGFFRILREAEHAAAKVALFSLPKVGIEEDDCALYKNFLQELARKEGFTIPVYATTMAGASHQPTFTSTVEVEGDTFHGVAAKSKKQSEMNAAKVAYFSLKEREASKFPFLPQSWEDFESMCSGSSSNMAGDFQQKLNLGCIFKSTPFVTGGDEEASSAEIDTSEVRANVDHPRTSPPKPRTGFERPPAPSAPSKECGSSSPTTVLEYSDCSATEKTLSCNRVRVYSRKPDMKFEKGVTVLPISDDNWVAVSSAQLLC